MKVRMKVEVSGTRNSKPWPRKGGVLDLPDNEGGQLCAGGLAEPVADRELEKAVQAEPEQRDEAEEPKKRGRPRMPRDDDGNVIRD